MSSRGTVTKVDTAKNSIEVDNGEFQLVNDQASPGNSKAYGTTGAGVKGYVNLNATSANYLDYTLTSDHADLQSAVTAAAAASQPLLIDSIIPTNASTTLNVPFASKGPSFYINILKNHNLTLDGAAKESLEQIGHKVFNLDDPADYGTTSVSLGGAQSNPMHWGAIISLTDGDKTTNLTAFTIAGRTGTSNTRIFIPSGTWVMQELESGLTNADWTTFGRTDLVGSGQQTSKFYLGDNENTSIFKLTNTTDEMHENKMSGLFFEGQASTNTSTPIDTPLLQLTGYNWSLQDIHMRDCAMDGIKIAGDVDILNDIDIRNIEVQSCRAGIGLRIQNPRGWSGHNLSIEGCRIGILVENNKRGGAYTMDNSGTVSDEGSGRIGFPIASHTIRAGDFIRIPKEATVTYMGTYQVHSVTASKVIITKTYDDDGDNDVGGQALYLSQPGSAIGTFQNFYFEANTEEDLYIAGVGGTHYKGTFAADTHAIIKIDYDKGFAPAVGNVIDLTCASDFTVYLGEGAYDNTIILNKRATGAMQILDIKDQNTIVYVGDTGFEKTLSDDDFTGSEEFTYSNMVRQASTLSNNRSTLTGGAEATGYIEIEGSPGKGAHILQTAHIFRAGSPIYFETGNDLFFEGKNYKVDNLNYVINYGRPVNFYDGTVGIPVYDHNFPSQAPIRLRGTRYYDGTYTLLTSTTQHMLRITATFVDEFFDTKNQSAQKQTFPYPQRIQVNGQTIASANAGSKFSISLAENFAQYLPDGITVNIQGTTNYDGEHVYSLADSTLRSMVFNTAFTSGETIGGNGLLYFSYTVIPDGTSTNVGGFHAISLTAHNFPITENGTGTHDLVKIQGSDSIDGTYTVRKDTTANQLVINRSFVSAATFTDAVVSSEAVYVCMQTLSTANLIAISDDFQTGGGDALSSDIVGSPDQYYDGTGFKGKGSGGAFPKEYNWVNLSNFSVATNEYAYLLMKGFIASSFQHIFTTWSTGGTEGLYYFRTLMKVPGTYQTRITIRQTNQAEYYNFKTESWEVQDGNDVEAAFEFATNDQWQLYSFPIRSDSTSRSVEIVMDWDEGGGKEAYVAWFSLTDNPDKGMVHQRNSGEIVAYGSGSPANNTLNVSTNVQLHPANRNYAVDTSAAARTLTLPPVLKKEMKFRVYDDTGDADTNNITISRNSNNLNGIASDYIIKTPYGYVEIHAAADLSEWVIINQSNNGSITPTTLAANTDDYSPAGWTWGVNRFRISASSTYNLTGIDASTFGAIDGYILILENVGTQTITLVHEATSSAANQLTCPNISNFAFTRNDTVILRRDTTTSKWRVDT